MAHGYTLVARAWRKELEEITRWKAKPKVQPFQEELVEKNGETKTTPREHNSQTQRQ